MRRAMLSLFALSACATPREALPTVTASMETAPVGSLDDAADDPAIWINAEEPGASLILGTDKKAGLYLYRLDGSVAQFLPAGALNNVDLRQDVAIGDWRGDIASASNRTDNTVTLFTVTEEGASVSGAIPSILEEPYGLCMGAAGGEAFVFVTYKTGDVIMYRLTAPGSGEEAGRLKIATQLEGCVFDDEKSVLYIGEENKGIWKAAYADGALGEPALVDEVGGASGLTADVEGLALYKIAPDKGYLIASSQGDYSYALYERGGENRFIGRFRLAPGESIDGAEETDGLDATAVALGTDYPAGVLIVQDGYNDPKGEAQNFKLVDWREVAKAAGLGE